MIDSINRRGLWKNQWFVATHDIFIKHRHNLLGIGRRKCHGLFETSELFPDFNHRARKTHIHHLVHLIDDECFHIAEINRFTLHEIHETTWRGNDDLRTFFQIFDLTTNRETTKNREWTHAHIGRNFKNFFARLHRELASWLENQNLWFTISSFNSIECWDYESSRFSWSSRGLHDKIFSVERERNYLCLHTCSFFVAHFWKRRNNLSTQGEIWKFHKIYSKNKKQSLKKWQNASKSQKARIFLFPINIVKLRQIFQKKYF